MVTATQKIDPIAVDPQGAFNPQYEQPWHDLSIAVGIPLTIFTALATAGLAFTGVTDPMLGWGGAVVLWTVYLATMGVLWVGVAAEGPR